MLGRRDMCARRFEDLTVWQLGDEIRQKVFELTETGKVCTDFRFRNNLRDAASSINRNIAEGFGRYKHKEFAQGLNVSSGSVSEVRDQLIDGCKRRYWTEAKIADLEALCRREKSALANFIAYLRSTPDV